MTKQIKGAYERLFKNLLTTLLGVLGLAVAAYCMVNKIMTYQELAGWVTTSVLFLRSKDSLLGIKEKSK